ncbi:aminoglycoside phosphotransferase family protein [Umezawaea sp. Da 62-37]|uniref:aminoglycoside phosphotransferase family protein n=1 Tax=Umezawaea sp. Da 62-37 TaxID=3075927 RepID=UPI0028F719A8|nr:aminoglycoside phosphotransferase family protein [Umezawaea sp. Da 62-37]WNV84735.1 aminoglycoside phosphotransferase family protein [Umezawaea sp. Da 62-37]
MTAKPFPAELRRWVTTTLCDLDEITDVSWPRGSSRVWRVHAGGITAFVKLSPTSLDFDREVDGYAYTAQVLTEHEAPRLLAAAPYLRAIISSPLPGAVVRGLILDKAMEPRVHEAAGRLLRRWHDLSAQASEQDRHDVREAMLRKAREATACLESTADHLDDDHLVFVQEAARKLPELAEALPLVYQHGDYSTRNWLWDGQSGRHALIDFAMAHHGVAVEEFVWLCGAVWSTRPDLRTAYLDGYGRPLTETEERLLLLLTVRLGVSYLNTGLIKQQADLVERGRLIVDRMTHQYR